MTKIFLKWVFILPIAVPMILGACKKPRLEEELDYIPPLVLATSLEDSLPSKAIKALNVPNTIGTKILYHNGLYASYFEYESDPNAVIETVSQLPFPISSNIPADTLCRPISPRDIETMMKLISAEEKESTANFWTSYKNKYDAFECIKGHFRHTLLVNRSSNRILHRIEFLG
jgi:hypothetical protein